MIYLKSASRGDCQESKGGRERLRRKPSKAGSIGQSPVEVASADPAGDLPGVSYTSDEMRSLCPEQGCGG